MQVLTYYQISLPHDIIKKIKINEQQTSQQKNPENGQRFCEAEKVNYITSVHSTEIQCKPLTEIMTQRYNNDSEW